MTGMDPVLNRRIATIFVSEFETFRRCLVDLIGNESVDDFQFNLHKIRPSLIIFELDKLVKQYENLSRRKKDGNLISEQDDELIAAMAETNLQIVNVKEFINSL
jgi:hypothetical protein